MTLQMDGYQLAMIIVAIIGGLWALGKTIWTQVEKNLDSKFEGIASANEEAKKANENVLRLEREVLKMQADMPLNYVRREDYIRGQTIIEAKIDSVAKGIQILQIQQGMKKDD